MRPASGLAAIQVGVPRRLFVLDVADEDEKPAPLVLFNPEIVALGSETRLHEEGCLSIPDFRIEIERPASLTLSYIDRDGNPRELDAEGLLATAIQHEVNHLDGKLIIDFLSPLKRDMVVRKFKKQARAATLSCPSAHLLNLGRTAMPLRIVFMGTPEFAVPTLAEIVGAGHEVVAAYTQPPRAAGRGMAERKSPVHPFAETAASRC